MTFELQQVYLGKMTEVLGRVNACEAFLFDYKRTNSIFALESGVLQLRKALESVSLAAIAPNKKAYEKLRSEAEKPVDYRRDYNGRKILQLLGNINKDFYPEPLLPPTKRDGQWHFERKSDIRARVATITALFAVLVDKSVTTAHGQKKH